MFSSIGFVNAFGVFQEYYSQAMLASHSASDISWLGSFNVFIMFAGGLLVGALLEKTGPRVCSLSESMQNELTAFAQGADCRWINGYTSRNVYDFPL